MQVSIRALAPVSLPCEPRVRLRQRSSGAEKACVVTADEAFCSAEGFDHYEEYCCNCMVRVGAPSGHVCNLR